MLRRRRLSSGVRLGPPLPLRLLNTLGPLVRSLGLWPRIDVERQMRATERKYKRDNWTPELRRGACRRGRKASTARTPICRCSARSPFAGSSSRAWTTPWRSRTSSPRHPEILDEQIRRPLFVLGLARTGTTLLQRLLSLHAGARYLPFWEGYTPYPREVGNHQGGKDGRYREAKSRLALLNCVGPEFNKIHPIEIDDPEECYHLFRNHFLVPPGFDFANVPSFWRWWDDRAHADAYRMHKRQLQALQWLNPNQHWVLKCPNHLSGLKHLLETYPDARIVYTQRDPLKTVPSLCSLAAVTWSMTSDTVDLHNVGEFALDLADRCAAAGRAAMQIVPRDQIVHVEYDDLVRDPAAMAMSIYERLGYPTDPALEGAHDAVAGRASERQARQAQLRAGGLRADAGDHPPAPRRAAPAHRRRRLILGRASFRHAAQAATSRSPFARHEHRMRELRIAC